MKPAADSAEHFPLNLLLVVAWVSALLAGCSAAVDAPASERQFESDPAYPHGMNAVEFSPENIRVTAGQITQSEKDLADVMGTTLWRFKVTLPPNTDTLAVSIDSIRTGQPIRHLHGLNNSPYNIGEKARTGGEVPIVVAVTPIGNLQGDGIMDSPNLRLFLKSPFADSHATVPNPFYHSTNGVETSASASQSRLLSVINNSFTNELAIHFRIFGYPDTNRVAAR